MTPYRPALWPSRRGIWLLLVVCALLALASVAPAAAVLLPMIAGALGALVVADLRLGPRASQLRLARSHSEYVRVGRRSHLDYVVENRCSSPLRLVLVEAAVDGVTFDEPATSLAIAARSRATLASAFFPEERGAVRFTAAYVRATNRIGLLERRFVEPVAFDVRVYPDFSAVEGYGTLARRSTLLETGLRKIRLRGAGTEFESLREYEAGDAFRAIDWKASAHRGRLMVAEYDVERSQTVILALDAGRLMTPRVERRQKFDYALGAALSAARVAQIAGDNVGLLAFAARTLIEVPPRRGVAHHARLVRAAYDLQPRLEEPDYEAFAAHVRRRYTKRSLIVVFTDLFDPAASAIVLASIALLLPTHLVLCVLMNDAAISDALSREPRDVSSAYRYATALRLEQERRDAVAALRARGVIVVDAAAQRLTVALLDAYLDVKAKGRL